MIVDVGTRKVQLAQWLMARRPARPIPPTDRIGDLQEIFDHPRFLEGSQSERREIMLASAQSKFNGELAYPWDNYFEVPIAPELRDRDVLDLGCFTGGRTVAWFERYRLRSIEGIDVLPVYEAAANAFASARNCPARFSTGVGESMPFADSSFDAILTFDVLEHVRDVNAVLSECSRVLRPGGRLFAVFPGYFQPNEHHLGLATRVPGLQLVFSGETLCKAYAATLDARGEESRWYRRESHELAPWERGHTLNGITVRQFLRVVRDGQWTVAHLARRPIGTVGRNITQLRLVATLSEMFRPLTYVPGLQEIFLHRISVILEKPVLDRSQSSVSS